MKAILAVGLASALLWDVLGCASQKTSGTSVDALPRFSRRQLSADELAACESFKKNPQRGPETSTIFQLLPFCMGDHGLDYTKLRCRMFEADIIELLGRPDAENVDQ